VLGPAVGVGVLLAVGGLIRAIGAEPSTFEAVLLSLVFVTGIGFGGVALAYGRVVPGLLRASVPDLRDLAATVVGYGLTFAAVFAGGVAAMAFRTATGIEPAQNQVAQVGQRDPTVLLLLIPAAFLLIGPGEELLFRGVVQGTLRRAFDPAPAIAIAAAVFAAIHYFALAGPSVGRVATIGVLFLPSLVFGAVYEYTDNLVVPSLIHGAYDATLFAVLYAVIRYGRSIDALSETREAAATLALLQ
jgi:membrane protease YdiL (CAAX protease family)